MNRKYTEPRGNSKKINTTLICACCIYERKNYMFALLQCRIYILASIVFSSKWCVCVYAAHIDLLLLQWTVCNSINDAKLWQTLWQKFEYTLESGIAVARFDAQLNKKRQKHFKTNSIYHETSLMLNYYQILVTNNGFTMIACWIVQEKWMIRRIFFVSPIKPIRIHPKSTWIRAFVGWLHWICFGMDEWALLMFSKKSSRENCCLAHNNTETTEWNCTFSHPISNLNWNQSISLRQQCSFRHTDKAQKASLDRVTSNEKSEKCYLSRTEVNIFRCRSRGQQCIWFERNWVYKLLSKIFQSNFDIFRHYAKGLIFLTCNQNAIFFHSLQIFFSRYFPSIKSIFSLEIFRSQKKTPFFNMSSSATCHSICVETDVIDCCNRINNGDWNKKLKCRLQSRVDRYQRAPLINRALSSQPPRKMHGELMNLLENSYLIRNGWMDGWCLNFCIIWMASSYGEP